MDFRLRLVGMLCICFVCCGRLLYRYSYGEELCFKGSMCDELQPAMKSLLCCV